MPAKNDDSPIHPDIGVIGLMPVEWETIWMSRQDVMTRLARHFHVVWSDPPRQWREWLGLERYRTAPVQDGRPPIPAGFSLYRPGPFLPRMFRPLWTSLLLERARLSAAARVLRSRGVQRIVLYLWRDNYVRALFAYPYDLACYHINDDYTFSTVEKPTPLREMQILRRVDRVFIHSPGLLEKKGSVNPHTVFVPNGVDFRSFASPVPEPDDLRAIPHPRVGYVGVVKEQLDIPLLLSIARAHPEWSVVLVGPSRLVGEDAAALDALRELPNGIVLGRKAVHELPAYMQHLDVGLLPYRFNDYTKYIYPLKLHEYLAAGIPVVASAIRSLQEHDDVITALPAGGDWVAAIAAAVRPGERSAERRAKRVEVARSHDWDSLVQRIADNILQGLEERRNATPAV